MDLIKKVRKDIQELKDMVDLLEIRFNQLIFKIDK